MERIIQVIVVAVSAAFLLEIAPALALRFPDSCGRNKTHNFEFGKMVVGDKLLNSTQIVRAREFFRIQDFDHEIQTKGRISYIQILDQNHDGRGGCVFLNGGGVGDTKVILHIKSYRNRGVNFIANVYGQ